MDCFICFGGWFEGWAEGDEFRGDLEGFLVGDSKCVYWDSLLGLRSF